MTVVLDASALLALLHNEPGATHVESVLYGALISTVNWSEVIQKARARGAKTDGLSSEISAAGVVFQPFSLTQAEIAGALWTTTRDIGLSLGDRACLALAIDQALPALTGDREWTRLSLPVEVQQIR